MLVGVFAILTVWYIRRYQQEGVGGDVPVASQPHDEFKLHKDTHYRFSFRLRPYRTGDDLQRHVAWGESVSSPEPVLIDTVSLGARARVQKRHLRIAALVALGAGLVALAISWLQRRRRR